MSTKYVPGNGFLAIHISAIDEADDAATLESDTQYALGYLRALFDVRHIMTSDDHDVQRDRILAHKARRLEHLSKVAGSVL